MSYLDWNYHWPLSLWNFQRVGPKTFLSQSLVVFESIMLIDLEEFALLVHAWVALLERNSQFRTFDRKDYCD